MADFYGSFCIFMNVIKEVESKQRCVSSKNNNRYILYLIYFCILLHVYFKSFINAEKCIVESLGMHWTLYNIIVY